MHLFILLLKLIYLQINLIFPMVGYYNTLVPSYPSGSIGFVMGSKKYLPAQQKNKDKKAIKDLAFYSPALHTASFVLPTFLLIGSQCFISRNDDLSLLNS